MFGRTLQHLLDRKFTLEEVTQSRLYPKRYSFIFRRYHFFNADVAAHSIENMGMKVMIIFFRSGYVEIDATTGPHRHTPNGYTRVVKLYPVTIWDTISCRANGRHRG